MSSLPLQEEGRVLVRLSDVPKKIRLQVAEEVCRYGKLRGLDALTMMLAAQRPSRTTMLAVDPAKAELVLRAGKRPRGRTPAVWSW